MSVGVSLPAKAAGLHSCTEQNLGRLRTSNNRISAILNRLRGSQPEPAEVSNKLADPTLLELNRQLSEELDSLDSFLCELDKVIG